MTKTRLVALLGGAASALFFLAVLGGSFGAVLVTFFAQLPIFLVGLMLGLSPALIAAAAGIVIVALSVGTDLAIRYFLMTPLPVLVVVRLVLLSRETEDGGTEWYPLGRVMGWLSAIGVGALVAATIYYLGSPGGLEGVVKTSLSAAVQQMPEQLRAPMQSFVDAIARYYPGIMIALTVITAMVNGVFAQWMAVQFGRNIRPTPAYSAVAAPEWMAIALALAGAGCFLSGWLGHLAQNAVIVFAAPFFFVGLAVIHSITVGWRGRPIVLIVVYLLLLRFAWLAAAVAAVGLIEPYLGLRRRFARRKPDQEEE